MNRLKQLFLLLSIFFSLQAQAQFSLGIEGGYIRSWEDYGETIIPENAVIHVNRLNLSLSAYYGLGKNFKIGIEPGYIQRGAACVPGWLGRPSFFGDTKFLLNYVALPIMVAKDFFVYKNKISLSVKLGYGVSYLVSGIQENVFIGSDDPPVRRDLDISGPDSSFNRWDHGWYGGLSIIYHLQNNQLFLSTDYYNAINDTDRFNSSQNRSLSFNLGYAIPLGE